MRLLLISDMADTGFGRVGRELGRRLLDRGWDLRCIGINWRGVDGELTATMRPGAIATQADAVRARLAELEADPLTDRIWPANREADGMGHGLEARAIAGRLWPGWMPDALIVVADPRAMWARLARDNGAIAAAKSRGIPTLNYVPIEGSGLPPDWGGIWSLCTPVAMSGFGRQQIEALTGQRVAMIHHGVSEAFRPLAPNDPGDWNGKPVTSKNGAKEAIDAAGRTVILRTDRFVVRKNYPALFRVMRPVLATRPEALVILHTVPWDDVGRGNLWQLISREPGAVPTGFSPSGDTVWEHPQYRITGWHDSFRGLTDAGLRVLYGAADLVVSPTMAEGFGLTLAEAAACGVPVIATDYSAIPEVIGEGGVLIPPASLWTNEYAHEWALVDEAKMTAAVERLIAKPSLRRKIGEAGRRHVARFTWSQAADQFDALLRASISELAPAPVG